jgi:hypothetical protein
VTKDPVSAWEDEGGARLADLPTSDPRHRSEQQQLDRSHVSTVRGEHRYPDAHQTVGERNARHERDDLKRRLAAGVPQPDWQR